MKKTYNKPEAIFDSFELTTSIASTCELLSNATQGICSVTDEVTGTTWYADGACNYIVQGNDGLCYHAPTDSSNVYSS